MHSIPFPPDAASQRILVVEDDPAIRTVNSKALARSGYQVETACDGEEAWQRLQTGEFSAMVTDNEMPRLKGLELIERLRNAGFGIPVVLASGAAWSLSPALARTLRITEVLPKPFVFPALIAAVERALSANPPPASETWSKMEGCLSPVI